MKQRKGWRMSCDVRKVTEALENELCRAHSPTLPSLHLRHSSFSNSSVAYLRHRSFSNPSVASPTSQLILQPFFRFFYVTGSSLTSPGEPPMSGGPRTVAIQESTVFWTIAHFNGHEISRLITSKSISKY